MNDFESLFRRYNPASLLGFTHKTYAEGIQDERKRILEALKPLNVDDFDDICYKTDIIKLIGPVDEI
jgi:hypothetical protein